MRYDRGIALAVAAALIMWGAVASASPHARRSIHPPIHVATPTGRSPITPYFFPYGSHYRYNSPGPVLYALNHWGPGNSCRLWRYNYVYWVC
jgi:hypothetical protein